MERRDASPDKRAPSAAAAAQMFMDLSQEYLELVPDRRSAHATIFGARTREQRAGLRDAILAVVLQRKFVTPRENIYLPGLLHRIYLEHKDVIPKEHRRKLREFQQELPPALEEIATVGMRLVDAAGNERPDHEQVDLVLNGRLLHADYPKWERAGDYAFSGLSGPLLVQQRRMRAYLHMTRSCLQDLHKWGVFALTWGEPQEDLVEAEPGGSLRVDTFSRSEEEEG